MGVNSTQVGDAQVHTVVQGAPTNPASTVVLDAPAGVIPKGLANQSNPDFSVPIAQSAYVQTTVAGVVFSNPA